MKTAMVIFLVIAAFLVITSLAILIYFPRSKNKKKAVEPVTEKKIESAECYGLSEISVNIIVPIGDDYAKAFHNLFEECRTGHQTVVLVEGEYVVGHLATGKLRKSNPIICSKFDADMVKRPGNNTFLKSGNLYLSCKIVEGKELSKSKVVKAVEVVGGTHLRSFSPKELNKEPIIEKWKLLRTSGVMTADGDAKNSTRSKIILSLEKEGTKERKEITVYNKYASFNSETFDELSLARDNDILMLAFVKGDVRNGFDQVLSPMLEKIVKVENLTRK